MARAELSGMEDGGRQWSQLPLRMLQHISSSLTPGQRLQLRALDRRGRASGGRVEQQRWRLEERAVLAATGGQIHFSAPARPRLPPSRGGRAEEEGGTAPGMPLKTQRRCRSLVRALLCELASVGAGGALVASVAELLESLQRRLEVEALPWSTFLQALTETFTAQGEASFCQHLLNLAHDAMGNFEVPELLYTAVAWPRPKRAEALVLQIEAKLELGCELPQGLLRKWIWVEVGIVDDEGLDAVPRTPCGVLHRGHDRASSQVVVQQQLEHKSPGASRVLQGVTRHLFGAGDEGYRLAFWVRARGHALLEQSLEVQSLALRLVCCSQAASVAATEANE